MFVTRPSEVARVSWNCVSTLLTYLENGPINRIFYKFQAGVLIKEAKELRIPLTVKDPLICPMFIVDPAYVNNSAMRNAIVRAIHTVFKSQDKGFYNIAYRPE